MTALRNVWAVDVDDYAHVAAFADSNRPSDWSGMLIGVENNNYRLFDLFDDNHLKVTVFVLGRVAE